MLLAAINGSARPPSLPVAASKWHLKGPRVWQCRNKLIPVIDAETNFRGNLLCMKNRMLYPTFKSSL